jgi:hypothetical protein
MQSHSAQLVEMLREPGFPPSDLLVIVGPPGSGKTRVVGELTSSLNWPLINLGKEASQRFLSMAVRQRKLKAEETISDVLYAADRREVCLDNTEILFDTTLALNPMLLLQNLSRTRRVIATWNGALENGSLVYAYPGHPEYFKQPLGGFPVVSLNDDKLYLF